MIQVNLLPESVLSRRRRMRRSALWFRVVIGYAVLWIGAVTASTEVVADPAGELEARLASLTASLNGSDASVGLLTARRDTLAGRARVVRDITGQPDWGVLLRHLATHVGDSVALRSVGVQLSTATGDAMTPASVAAGPYEVVVVGVASGQAEATGYALELEKAGLFASLTLTQTAPTRVEQRNAVQFELRGVITRGSTP
ncbi:MAG: hypothetical protein ACTS22_04990 [Phycisphaerales bacterium]